MEFCYLCDEKLTATNSSKEHILLNSIGGRLRSKELLCKDCNSKFGHDSDRELAKQLQFLCNYLNIKREKGENQPLRGLTGENGKKYNLVDGSNPTLSKPDLKIEKKDNQINYSISARNENELIEILKGIKKKHPQLDIEEAKKHFKWKEEYLDEMLNHEMTIGGELAFKSIVKTAINYYILERNEKTQISHLLPYLKNEEKVNVIHHFNPQKAVFKKEIGEVAHTIHLVGNKYNKVLYCFIEFFSCYSFLMLLSENYIGKNFTSTYVYDVIKNNKIEREIKLNLKSDFIKDNIQNPKPNFDILQAKIDRVMKIGDKIQTDKQISYIVSKAVNKIFDKYSHEQIVTKEMINEISSEVATEFVKFKYKNKRK